MERKHVSAFALYQNAKKASIPAVPEVAAKKKRKENGIEPTKSIKKAKRSKDKQTLRSPQALKSPQTHKSPLKTERLETFPHEVQSVESDGEALEALLIDLAGVSNSKTRAARLFQWLVMPVLSNNFFRDTWEKKPILIQRQNPDYYKGLFSTAEFDRILRHDDVQYGVNLDVTSYTDGKRETHNPPGRALPHTVWDFYESGCSLRLLNPQAFSSTVWNVLSILQEQFGSMAGANVYLTPPGTQGFAPHYDDIEAFVLQLEGKKHWRVYNPRSDEEVLPVVSSPNFSQAEIGKPVLEVVLEAGDLLYFPRGFIHQGDCLPDAHSLHITVSSFQKNSWGDLLAKVVPAALQVAMEEDVEFRRGLPLEYLSFMGVQNSEKEDERRLKFLDRIGSLMGKLVTYAPVDAAVDQKAREFFHDCLPPVLTPEEHESSVYGAPARWEDGEVRGAGVPMKSKALIRLIRDGCARLCSDGEEVHLYYIAGNSRVYHKEEPKSLIIEPEHTDAIEFLIHSYPAYVTVGSLPCENPQDKVSLAEMLFEKGIIQTG